MFQEDEKTIKSKVHGILDSTEDIVRTAQDEKELI